MLIREVQISEGGAGIVGLPLHPQITVIAGLDPAGQVELADLVAAVIYGRIEELGGSVEVGGEVIHVEAWAEMVGEDLDAVDVFVRPEDIPRPPPARDDDFPSPDLDDRANRLAAAVDTAREHLRSAERTVVEAVATERRARAALEDARGVPELRGDARDPDDPAAIPGDGSSDPDQPEASTNADPAALIAVMAGHETRLEEARDVEREAATAVERHQSIVETRQAELAEATLVLGAATSGRDELAVGLEDLRRQLDATRATLEAERLALLSAQASAQAEAESRAAAQAAAEPAAADHAEATARAERALAEADHAAGELGRSAAVVEEAEAALESARLRLDEHVDVVGAELAHLDRRAEQLVEDLARARAEESLFAGLTAAPQEAGSTKRAPTRRKRRQASIVDGGSPATNDGLAVAEAEARRATARAASLRAEMDALVTASRPSTLRGGELVDRRRTAADRLEQIRQEIDALRASPDLGVLAAAVQRLVEIPTDDQVAGSDELLGALDELIDARAAGSLSRAPSWLVEAARTGLEEARIELARAEEMYRPMRVSPEDAAALEAAHTAIDEAESKAEKRFGGALARRRLEKATADERELLVRLGLPSYTAFVLRTMPMANDSEAAVHLEVARRAMADAEAVWEELHQGSTTVDAADTEEAEARALARAAAILGPQAMGRADTSNPSATLRSVRDLLAGALASVTARSQPEHDLAAIMEGIAGLETDGSDVLADAMTWLEFHDVDGRRRTALYAEMVEIADDLEHAQQSIDELEEAPAVDPEVRARLEKDLEQAELDAATARDHLHGAAIASGIAPAAAAVAADPALLLVGTGQPGAESGEAHWVRQSSAEVEISRRDIAAIQEEAADVAVRRAKLADGLLAERSDAHVDALIAALRTAEAVLSEARRVADAASGAAEEALQALDTLDAAAQATAPVPLEVDAEDRTSQIAARLAAAQDGVDTATRQIALAEERLAGASADVAARGEDRTRCDERHQEAVGSLDVCRQLLREATQATLDCERDVLSARRELESAEAAARGAAALSEARRVAVEASAARAIQRDRARAAALAAVDLALAAHAQAETSLGAAHSDVEIARTALSSAEKAQTVGPSAPTSDGELSSRSPEHRVDGGEAEIYVLSRLATARSVGAFGAVPLILLDPFVGLPSEESGPIHELIVRMGPVVQMIYVTADPGIVRWGTDLGPAHATVLQFGAPVPHR
ncbi:MAG: hypothetical protein NVS3B12_07760 [Acidimicrobiales bacterium]